MNNRPTYTLQDDIITHEPNFDRWRIWLINGNRQERVVGHDRVGDITIRTEFTGVAELFEGKLTDPPLLFETRVWDVESGEILRTLATESWEIAEQVHDSEVAGRAGQENEAT